MDRPTSFYATLDDYEALYGEQPEERWAEIQRDFDKADATIAGAFVGSGYSVPIRSDDDLSSDRLRQWAARLAAGDMTAQDELQQAPGMKTASAASSDREKSGDFCHGLLAGRISLPPIRTQQPPTSNQQPITSNPLQPIARRAEPLRIDDNRPRCGRFGCLVPASNRSSNFPSGIVVCPDQGFRSSPTPPAWR